MSGTQVSQEVSVHSIVQRVAELRAEKATLQQRISNANYDMGHGDQIDINAARDEADACEKQVSELDQQILQQARLIAEPHPLWPGGWLIEKIGQDDDADRWIAPSVRWDTPPGTPGAQRRAWRTRTAAEAAVPADGSDAYRVVWSPLGIGCMSGALTVPLDAVSLDAVGSPRVRVANHFDKDNPWSYSGGQPEFVYVVALPTPEVADLARRYAPVLDDQPALAAVPQEWLHLKLWLDPGYFQPSVADIDAKLAERVRVRRPDITADAVDEVLAILRRSPDAARLGGDRSWDYCCAMEELLRGSPLPAAPAFEDWAAMRNAGLQVPTFWNWAALPLVTALREELFSEARQPALDSFAAHFADQPMVNVTVGPAIADDNGVSLDVSPDVPLEALIDRCETWPAMKGRREQRRSSWRSALPIAYSTSDAQVDLTGLYDVRDRLTWSITELAVVAMRRDTHRGYYTWTELDRVALRSDSIPSSSRGWMGFWATVRRWAQLSPKSKM